MTMLYRAFGEKSTLKVERTKLVPKSVELFVADMYWALGGVKLAAPPWEAPENEYESYRQREKRERTRAKLAQRAIDYLQLEEALGRPPTLKEIGQPAFEREARAALGEEIEQAWIKYTRAIQDAVRFPQGREQTPTNLNN